MLMLLFYLYSISSVGENNIGPPKMRNKFQTVHFPNIDVETWDFLIALHKSIALPTLRQ